MVALAERRQYDDDYRADLRSGAEGLDYEPPALPDFSVSKGPRNTLRRQMTTDEAKGLIAMRNLQRKPLPNSASGGF